MKHFDIDFGKNVFKTKINCAYVLSTVCTLYAGHCKKPVDKKREREVHLQVLLVSNS